MNLWNSLTDGSTTLFAAGASFMFPPQSSATAPTVDRMYYFIYYLSIFFFVLIIGVSGYFVWKYRRRPGVEPQPSANHNLPLELTW
ncbi:MAG: hypothetical protein ACRC1K_18095, partial [Planctomycetia bacterium]